MTDPATLVQRLRNRNGRPDGFGLGPVCDEAADTIDRLRAELASVKEDAERYRWLKACASENDDGEIFLYYLCDFDHYNDPDASIDAARSAPKER